MGSEQERLELQRLAADGAYARERVINRCIALSKELHPEDKEVDLRKVYKSFNLKLLEAMQKDLETEFEQRYPKVDGK